MINKSFTAFLIAQLAIGCICTAPLVAQKKATLTSVEKNKVYGGFAHSGFIFVHTKQVENTRGAKPKGIEFEYSTQLNDSATYQHWGFYTRSGYTFSYFDFGTKILGKSLSAGYFIEPIYKLGKRSDLRIKGTVGLSYLSNPGTEDIYSTHFDTSNHTYSSYVNAFLQLGISYGYQINNHYTLQLKGSYNHNSNGGFTKPNRGINFPTASIGLLYHTQSNHLKKYKRIKQHEWKLLKPSLTVGFFATPKEGYKEKYQRKLVIGGWAQVAKQVSSFNAVTGTVEAYYDGALALTKSSGYMDITTNTLISDKSSNKFVSMAVGNEFLINKFTFFQQFGYHLLNDTKLYNQYYRKGQGNIGNWYQRYGLNMRVAPKWQVGFSLLARGSVADFIDLRCMYRIK